MIPGYDDTGIGTHAAEVVDGFAEDRKERWLCTMGAAFEIL